MQFQNASVFILGLLLSTNLASAAPLSSATVTETKNDVRYKGEAAGERAAKLQDVVRAADVLRTGERSLAELEFNDKTITRLGSKSIFTFSSAGREFRVGQGLALVCVPKGTGGGRIVTSAITAAIEGTTVVAEQFVLTSKHSPPPRRGAKLIFLEGRGRVFHRDGKQSKPIHAGQMIVQFDDDPALADVQDVDLKILVAGSGIINEFARPLSTGDAVAAEIDRQQHDIKRGTLVRQEPGLPTEMPAVNDPLPRDSGAMIALSEQLPCPCQPGP